MRLISRLTNLFSRNSQDDNVSIRTNPPSYYNVSVRDNLPSYDNISIRTNPPAYDSYPYAIT